MVEERVVETVGGAETEERVVEGSAEAAVEEVEKEDT